jgi:hypothetical protein
LHPAEGPLADTVKAQPKLKTMMPFLTVLFQQKLISRFAVLCVFSLCLSTAVHAQNLPPVAGDDEAVTQENTPVSGNLAENDWDPNNNVLTYTLLTGTADGTIVINPNGTFTYTPNPNEYGLEFLYYQVCDPGGLCDIGELLVAVFFVNDPPTLGDDMVTAPQGQTVSGNLALNDVDLDDEPISFFLISGPASGLFTLSTNGNFSYTPAPGFTGVVTAVVSGCDPCLACDVSTVFITVTPPNGPPVAVDDYLFLNEDSVTAGNLAANDSDPNADPLTYSLVTPPSSGNLVINANGTFSFTPAANFNGSLLAWYQACDPSGLCDQATLTLEVGDVNDPPMPVNDFYTVNEDGVLTGNVLINDMEVEQETLVCSALTFPANGILVLQEDGDFTYTPAPNFVGVNTFNYVAIDPFGEQTIALVTITVVNVNETPVANDETVYMNEDEPWTGSVALNDSDPDGDALVYSVIDNANQGTFVMNSNGTFTYTPNLNFSGLDFVVYTACDAGGLCNDAMLMFEVFEVNDTPIAFDDFFNGLEDTPVTGNVFLNDIEPENETMIFDLIQAVSIGTLNMGNGGNFTYIPPANWSGVATFTYMNYDPCGVGDLAYVTITIAPVNDIPVANNDFAYTDEDVAVSGSVALNDTDADAQPLTFTVVTGANHGTFTLNANGSYSYTPNLNWFGMEVIVYSATDPAGASDPANLVIEVGDVNDAPNAVNDVFSTDEDVAVSGNAALNDTDAENHLLEYSLLSPVTGGTLIMNLNGTFTFTPAANWFGIVTVTYLAVDLFGLEDTATLTITVNSVNDIPVANNDVAATNEDVTLNGNVAANDTDADGTPLTFTVITGPANGVFNLNTNGTYSFAPPANWFGVQVITYRATDGAGAFDNATLTITTASVNDTPVVTGETFNTGEDQPFSQSLATNDSDVENVVLSYAADGASHGVFTLSSNGSFYYAPDQDWHGTEVIAYQATDSGGLSASGTLIIVVDAINDTPQAVDESQNIGEDMPENGNVALNDSDVDDDNLTYNLLTQPVFGNVVFQPNGSFFYAPFTDFTGTDSFTYQACDDEGACDSATITINVGQANDAPVAQADTFSLNEDGQLSATVSANDYDFDGDPLTFSLTGNPQFGAILFNANGSFTYTPAPNANGTEVLSYNVCDPYAACATGTLTIVVNPVNDVPSATNGAFTTNEDMALSGSLAALATDVESTALVFSLLAEYENIEGTLTLTQNGNFSYEPPANFNGAGTAMFSACDPQGACATGLIQFTVTAVNDAPVAGDDVLVLQEDDSETVNLAADDTDADGDLLSFSIVSPPGHGNYMLTGGVLTYTPEVNYFGPDELVYTVCDGLGACDIATLSITVLFVNDLPQTLDDTVFGFSNQLLNGNVALNDIELDPEILTYQTLVTAQNGLFILNFDGTFSYLPNDGFTGVETIVYMACDPCGACDSASLVIHIDEPNSAPVVIPAQTSICQDQQASLALDAYISDAEDADNNLVITSAGASIGSVELSALTHTLIYTPDTGFEGEVQITYTVCDNGSNPLCTDGEVTINVTGVIPVTLTESAVQHVSCLGGNNGSITLEVAGALGTFSFDWSNGSSLQSLTNLAAGNYTVNVQNSAVCSIDLQETFVIEEPEAALTISGLTADAINDTPGGSSVYEVTGGTSPYSFAWTNEEGIAVSNEQALVLNDAAQQGAYTLLVTDSQGCTAEGIVLVTGIEDISGAPLFEVFPVPAGDWLSLNTEAATFTVELTDMSGRLVLRDFNTRTLDVSALAGGNYLLRLTTGMGSTTTRVIIAR